MAQYHTVFAIGLGSFPWGIALVPSIMIVIGLGLIRFSGKKQIRQAVGAAAIIFSLFFLLLLSISSVSEFLKERRTYASGHYFVVEGQVENFHPRPALGRADESFSVNGVNFSYNVLDDTACFHNAHPRGIIRPGLDVRVFYADGCILRLDVRPGGPR